MYTIDIHEYNRYSYLLYQSPDCISVHKTWDYVDILDNMEIGFYALCPRIQTPQKYLIDFAKALMNWCFKLDCTFLSRAQKW